MITNIRYLLALAAAAAALALAGCGQAPLTATQIVQRDGFTPLETGWAPLEGTSSTAAGASQNRSEVVVVFVHAGSTYESYWTANLAKLAPDARISVNGPVVTADGQVDLLSELNVAGSGS